MAFFRLLDSQRSAMASRKHSSHTRQERIRQDPNPSEVSKLTSLPESLPIDYFDPLYWNNELTLQERVKWAGENPRIALPLARYCSSSDNVALWKGLSEEEFMSKYGKEVLKEYEIPTKEDREFMERFEEKESEEVAEE